MTDFNNMPMDSGGVSPAKKPTYNPNDYAPFGEQSDYAFNQGWQPVVSSGGATTYRNKYAPAFGGVMVNNKPTGNLEIVGNKNGLFDVQINKGDGKIEKIMTAQPFNKVDDYFRNSKSIIQQRMDRVQQDPNTVQQGIVWNQ